MSSLFSTPTAQTHRFWTLDAIRGLAVLAVVCFHVLPSFEGNTHLPDSSTVWISWLQPGGVLGVSIFFVLSGFSIHLSQARKAGNQRNNCHSWSKFFWRRILRLYPAYLGAIAVAVGLNVTWALIKGRNPWLFLPSIWDVLSHLLLLHTLSPDTFFGIIPALWFIGVQVHFYLLYPLFCWLIQRWNIDRALLIVLVCTLAFRLLSQSLILTSTAHPQFELVLWMNAPQRWFEWCFGAWIAHQVAQGRRLHFKYVWVIFFLIIFWISTGSNVKVLYEPILGGLVGFLIWCIVTHENRLQTHSVWRPILYLGQISYPVYLLHQIFVPYIKSAIPPNLLNMAGLFVVTLGLVMVITLPLSTCFHYWLELPFSKLKLKPQP
ncbi:MAG: acyltransferase [Coleofasciculaceae cyanobacterium]